MHLLQICHLVDLDVMQSVVGDKRCLQGRSADDKATRPVVIGCCVNMNIGSGVPVGPWVYPSFFLKPSCLITVAEIFVRDNSISFGKPKYIPVENVM